MPSSGSSILRTLWRSNTEGVRVNLIPGFALWGFGLAVVLIYYYVPGSHAVFDQVSAWKERFGYGFSALSTAVFGGVIPFLYLSWTGRVPPGRFVSWGLFFLVYWTIRGVEVDFFYRLQAYWFGDQADWGTIVTKVVVDQFLYCPLWAAPVTAVCYGWKRAGFSWIAFRPNLKPSRFLFQIASLLLSTWMVWIPATAIIYSLPLVLQIPLFNLVLCFFVLLISVLSPRREEDSAE